MRHSTPGSMTESPEPQSIAQCSKTSESVLQKLYIDLCNLIVESRIPGVNERGYGDGLHCPPAVGASTHSCDLSKIECQKHQRLMCHLLGAVQSNIFEVEVVMLPECCSDTKLKERIEKKEYVLLEKWSMNCFYGSRKAQTTIDVSQLLRAVRSFLHFSQISAWLSSNKGKSPSNIYYWIKPHLDELPANFEKESEVHYFPVCKISEDFYGCVEVKYPPRTAYVPIIPCSKHPPLYPYRNLSEDPNLCRTVPLNPEIVRQLQKSCDTHGVLPTHYTPETDSLMINPTTLLKTFADNIEEKTKSKIVLKHTHNTQENMLNSCSLSYKSIDVIPSLSTSYVCNFAETYTKALSQESGCFDQEQFASRFRIKEIQVRDIVKDTFSTQEISMSPAVCSTKSRLNSKYLSDCIEPPSQLSSASVTSDVFKSFQTSLPRTIPYQSCVLMNVHAGSSREIKTKSLKRKVTDSEPLFMLPLKKVHCDILPPSDDTFSHFSDVMLKENDHTSQFEDIHSLGNFLTNSFEFSHKASNSNVSKPPTWIENYNLSSNILTTSSKSLPIDRRISHELSSYENISANILAAKRLSAYNSKNSNTLALASDSSSVKSIFQKSCPSYGKKEKSGQKFRKSNINKNSSSIYIEKIPCSVPCKFSKSEKYRKHFASYSHKVSKNIKIAKCDKNGNDSNCETVKALLGSPDESEIIDFPIDVGLKRHLSHQKIRFNSCANENHVKKSKQVIKSHSLDNSKICEKYTKRLAISRLGKSTNAKLKEDSKNENPVFISPLAESSHFSENKCCSSSFERKRKNVLESTSFVEITKKKRKCFHLTSDTSLKSTQMQGENGEADRIKKADRLPADKANYEFDSTEGESSQNFTLKNVGTPLDFSANLRNNTQQNLNSIQAIHSENISIESVDANITQNFCKKIGSNDTDVKENYINRQKKISIPENSPGPLPFRTLFPPLARGFPYGMTEEDQECFPGHKSKFPKSKGLLMNFEESILRDLLPVLRSVQGFRAEIGASGNFCPSHLTLPANVSFYQVGSTEEGAAPYVAHVELGDTEYFIPKKGAVQVTLFNPSDTVVKMFVLNYDLSSMPPSCHTFMRQKTYSLPVGSAEDLPESQKWLRFIFHLRFASSKTGKIFLHKDFKIVVLNKSHDDAASEFSQEPRELRSFLTVPVNPTFSNIGY